MIKRILAVIAVTATLLVAGTPKADAHVGFSVGIGIPGVYVGPPVVYAPPAYYYPPAPAYYYPYSYGYGYGYAPAYGYGYAPYYGGSVYFGGRFGHRGRDDWHRGRGHWR